ncbi:hypothetical protein [Paracoccus sp. SCSIO 75233]|nr:hypothetical protein [Paracoccus sp. SCSIO 75233]WBU53664.1 hypothetical protein PAF12_02150 [Paracoccus sp. SCSIO 75233]
MIIMGTPPIYETPVAFVLELCVATLAFASLALPVGPKSFWIATKIYGNS